MIEADFSLFIIVLSTIPKKPTVNSIAGKIAKKQKQQKVSRIKWVIPF